MKYFFSKFITVAFLFMLSHSYSYAAPPCYGDYPKEPPFLSQSAKASTTLLIDFSGSLNEHAYQGTDVKWDNGTTNATAYMGYDDNTSYYGYFNPDLHYEYSESKFVNATNSSTTWSGNFLNWTSMLRIDIMKKALTGGNYNSTNLTYTVSKPDGKGGRGRYHIINVDANATFIPNAYRGKLLGFEQGPDNEMLKMYEMNSTNSDPETYKPLTEPIAYKLSVASEEQLGAIQLMGPSTRLSLFTFDDSDPAEGGKALVYMTDDIHNIITTINDKSVLNASSWSPLSESLYTVLGYIQNATTISSSGPRYKDSSYTTSRTRDPFYFSDTNSTISCTQQNIIIVSDGIPSQDKNVPFSFKSGIDYDKSKNDDPNIDGTALDNLAYWAHTTDLRPNMEGEQNVNIYTIALYSNSTGSKLLEEAARWGGFTDFNGDGIITKDELEDEDGKPYTFFDVVSDTQAGKTLEEALSISLGSTAYKASSGGAASVVSTSRKGEGLLYQPIFWPQLIDSKGKSISWAGDVLAYWLDDAGILYEDNGNNNTAQLGAGDTPIVLWYDESDPNNKRTRVCPSANFQNGTCSAGAKELKDVVPVWSAADELNRITNSTLTGAYKAQDRRYIFTWIDTNNDGKIDSGEQGLFHESNTNLLTMLGGNKKTINWIRGEDQVGFRSRQIQINPDANPVTWRLGDIINSSPTVAGTPAENYHIYWKDPSYKLFFDLYKNRRIMTYFGANDGMLHAVNSGFYSEKDKKFYTNKEFNDADTTSPNLGAEMWAYVPYNLIPHLECLTKPGYMHQYYVDLKPRIFDVKAFKDSDPNKYPGGWGTILVGGFNFGGDGSQNLPDNRLPASKPRLFGSSYFILDITDPESPPTLLGEMTFDGTVTLGFSINSPAVVATTDGTLDANGAKNTFWYLLFGNGPENLNGGSSQSPYGLVVPLTPLIKDKSPLRLTSDKNKLPGPTETKMGFIDFGQSIGTGKLKACVSTGFVSIDYDLNYFVDMMYYGIITTEGTARKGGMHRLRIENRDPSKWSVKEMTSTQNPITGAPNAALKDNVGKTGSIWVSFGSGIFWENDHKQNRAENWLYGIEEPKKTGSYNFSPIDEKFLLDVTGIGVNGTDGLGTLVCEPNFPGCNIPSGVKTVEELGDYIQNTPNIDGWRRKLASGERVLGQPTLFGGLTNFTTYTPADDLCSSEGNSKLYALYYRTGTAWKENVFGDSAADYVPYVVDIGRGVSTTPSLHLGSEAGVRAYLQTSTGAIIEIHQPNLPVTGVNSGMGGWHTINVD